MLFGGCAVDGKVCVGVVPTGSDINIGCGETAAPGPPSMSTSPDTPLSQVENPTKSTNLDPALRKNASWSVVAGLATESSSGKTTGEEVLATQVPSLANPDITVYAVNKTFEAASKLSEYISHMSISRIF